MYFHFNIIPIALNKDIMLNFKNSIHVYGCILSILWSLLKKRMPKKLMIANFRHPVSKSWQRHNATYVACYDCNKVDKHSNYSMLIHMIVSSQVVVK